MCTQRLWDSSDRVGALSQSSNDTVNSEDVDSASLGTLPELWYLLQESDIAILVLVVPVSLHMGIVVQSISLLGSNVK